MSNNLNSKDILTSQSVESVYTEWEKAHKQKYYTTLSEVHNEFKGKLGGVGPFGRRGSESLIENEAHYGRLTDMVSGMFNGDEVKKQTAKRLMNNFRNVHLNSRSEEGWGGSSAVYASAQGALPASIMPFIIGGFLATSNSQEIYNIITQDNSRLNFSYNIDYLLWNDKKYYYPMDFRAGKVAGFNDLPAIEWSAALGTWGNDATWAPPSSWIGKDGYMDFHTTDKPMINGNILEAAKASVQTRGIEGNGYFGMVKYTVSTVDSGTGVATVVDTYTKKTQLNYEISTGQVNKRIYKKDIVITHTHDNAGTPVELSSTFAFLCDLSLDTGTFSLGSQQVSPAISGYRIDITGVKFFGRLSNIQNEDMISTFGTDKFEFVKEVTYKQYTNAGLNEYMTDNFNLGANSISWPAYAIDNLLEYTLFERETAAENHLIGEIESGKTLDQYVLTPKLGGFIQSDLQFDIGKMAPGLGIQDYKEGLKTFLNRTLALSETFTNVPQNVKKDWILLGYDGVVSEFPEIKFEDVVVNNNDNPIGGAANQQFGFSVKSRCGYVDSFGRSVRIIGNPDKRWLDRGGNVYGTVRTYNMEYPFFVYYPYAIRMMTMIDPRNPNRTAITIGGREFRDAFAMCAIKLRMDSVLTAAGVPINNFEQQVESAKTFNAETPSQVVVANTATQPVYMAEVAPPTPTP